MLHHTKRVRYRHWHHLCHHLWYRHHHWWHWHHKRHTVTFTFTFTFVFTFAFTFAFVLTFSFTFVCPLLFLLPLVRLLPLRPLRVLLVLPPLPLLARIRALVLASVGQPVVGMGVCGNRSRGSLARELKVFSFSAYKCASKCRVSSSSDQGTRGSIPS